MNETRSLWAAFLTAKSGPVAQLGARFHGMEEVVGSIPTRSTNSLWKDDALTGVIVLQVPASLASERSSVPPLEPEAIGFPNLTRPANIEGQL